MAAEGEDEAAIESAVAELTTQHQARKQVYLEPLSENYVENLRLLKCELEINGLKTKHKVKRVCHIYETMMWSKFTVSNRL